MTHPDPYSFDQDPMFLEACRAERVAERVKIVVAVLEQVTVKDTRQALAVADEVWKWVTKDPEKPTTPVTTSDVEQ